MATDGSLLAPAIIIAALVVRTALGELRQQGTAREQWAFATDRRAIAAGATTAGATILLGWHQAGPAAVAWALLIGALTAHLVHRDGDRP
ncbi:hypothetical protein [Streptomyces caniscabiei]|uniref:hypothetical protein n=1 Tax=Streptomyces caniscabiei TaxID=2746961 RepID=UPI000A37472E|nr:hypothetical protein [Streptomyces caniscabiei]MBD9701153.1 hypothetical protein [Streptomyces caniscabiei]MDX3726670.1 hypothetical protein [Streptomyces caniscabiei]